jgi:hypothetical protein
MMMARSDRQRRWKPCDAADLLPVVTVSTRDAFASEPSSNSVLNGDLPYPTVWADERRLDGQLTPCTARQRTAPITPHARLAAILPAQRSVAVIVRPLVDSLTEGIETVVLRLEGPLEQQAQYRVGLPRRALALIRDRPWAHSITDTRCDPLPDGMRHVCFGAQTGYNFRIEASSDFRNWETICATSSADEAVHHVDDEAQNFPRRFYRLSLEPVIDPED